MTLFTDNELTGLRFAQQSHMNDVCQVGARSETRNEMGEVIPGFTYGEPTPCGCKMTGSESLTLDGHIVRYDAVIRLPHGTVVGVNDKVKVTHRYGVALLPAEVYNVASPAESGPSGVTVLLRRTTT